MALTGIKRERGGVAKNEKNRMEALYMKYSHPQETDEKTFNQKKNHVFLQYQEAKVRLGPRGTYRKGPNLWRFLRLKRSRGGRTTEKRTK